jgi:hypothetical protein
MSVYILLLPLKTSSVFININSLSHKLFFCQNQKTTQFRGNIQMMNSIEANFETILLSLSI